MSMEAGGVENPGAINSRDDDASVSSNPELMDAPIEDNGINFDAVANSNMATNEEKDYSFSSKDISKHKKTEFFTNVEGAEKRAKKAERDKLKQERRSRKKILKEASETKKNELRERNQNEAKKNREVNLIRGKYRFGKVREFVWRHRLIIIIVVAVTIIATLAAIFAPKIIDDIDRAKREQLVSDNKSVMMKIFATVAGKAYSSRDELESEINNVSKDAKIEYSEDIGKIIISDNYLELVKFYDYDVFGDEDSEVKGIGGFAYEFNDDDDNLWEIFPTSNGFILDCSNSDLNINYETAEDAIKELIMRKVANDEVQ